LAARIFGFSPAVLFRVIAVFSTLGLIVTYVFLRRIEGRALAAAACLLLGSSPALFGFNTAVVSPETTFFFMSMLVLLLSLKICRADPGRTPSIWILVLGVALALAVLIRSVGIALVIGLGTWILASLVVAPEIGRRRLRRFLLPIALGAAVQFGWSAWAQRHQVLEWQLPGYPESYVSQLKVKNGQYPELGLAQLSDIPSRVAGNIVARAAGLGSLLTQRFVSAFWSSPAIAGVLILILLGLTSSLRRKGGQLHDWYFLWYEVIFSLWPWNYADRFLYPVAPLACLYLWRGAKVLKEYSIQRPKAFALYLFLCGAFLSICSAAFAARLFVFRLDLDHSRGDRVQPIVATVFWGALAVIGLGLLRFHSVRNSPVRSHPFANLSRIAGSWVALPLQIGAIVVLTVPVASGLERQMALGRTNLNPDVTQQFSYPEIEASNWIRTHEPSAQVLMARDQDIAFHYTRRRVVWFPPISDPKVLMDGIRRYNVEFLIVAHHSKSYWLPTEEACFQSLAQTYGSAFHLVNRGRDYQVFEVMLQ